MMRWRARGRDHHQTEHMVKHMRYTWRTTHKHIVERQTCGTCSNMSAGEALPLTSNSSSAGFACVCNDAVVDVDAAGLVVAAVDVVDVVDDVVVDVVVTNVAMGLSAAFVDA